MEIFGLHFPRPTQTVQTAPAGVSKYSTFRRKKYTQILFWNAFATGNVLHVEFGFLCQTFLSNTVGEIHGERHEKERLIQEIKNWFKGFQRNIFIFAL